MLSETDLFEALKAFSPRTRLTYKIMLFAGMVTWTILSVVMIACLSMLLAWWLVTPDLSTSEMTAAIITPAVMAFAFVAAGFRSANDPRFGKARNMTRAAWRGARAGFVMGLVIVGFVHFLGQLLLTRAIYGPSKYQSRVFSYCGPTPVFYGILFALPVAAGTGLFAALATVNAQVVYEIMTALEKRQGCISPWGRFCNVRDDFGGDRASPTLGKASLAPTKTDSVPKMRHTQEATLLNRDTSPRDDLLITLLVSLWSAMLGGAIGATTGMLGEPFVCQAPFGFIGGLIASVMVYLPLMGTTRAIEWLVMHKELDGQTVSGLAGDKLAGLLGGMTGAIGAVVAAALPGNANFAKPYVAVTCWTVAASVAIVLGLIVIYFIRWEGHG